MHGVTYFAPQPDPAAVPERLPSPFDPGPPHPLARRAAAELTELLRRRPPDPAGRGKMFGVLVVAGEGGRVGYLRGFSGTLDGRWLVDGFVGPLFDVAARERAWPEGAPEMLAFDPGWHLLPDGPAVAEARAALAALDRCQAEEAAALAAEHRVNRERRRARRDGLVGAGSHALDQESRADSAARRRLRVAHAQARAPLAERLRQLEEQQAARERHRAERSSVLLEQLFAGYQVPNARGQERSLREIFAPEAPPGGAGDCAGPKLLGHALRAGLRPLALAELWWGPPPAAGGRHDGVFYPSCRGKCGPVLAHMLEGLAVEPAPLFGGGPIGDDEPVAVLDDPWLVVVDKPVGLLSVPGRSPLLRDSVLVRLAARHPGATGPMIVHRLDLDTSGLLLAAKDAGTYRALQRQFAGREIEKRYVAWLDGRVAGEEGTIDLALRVDLDDRPRQIHDPVHGKTAVTDWRVLGREDGRTRVAFYPRTGRTHQLRVHAAHPRGLAAPIAGDRLYGHGGAGERLLLHAEALTFVHPHTGQTVHVERPAAF